MKKPYRKKHYHKQSSNKSKIQQTVDLSQQLFYNLIDIIEELEKEKPNGHKDSEYKTVAKKFAEAIIEHWKITGSDLSEYSCFYCGPICYHDPTGDLHLDDHAPQCIVHLAKEFLLKGDN